MTAEAAHIPGTAGDVAELCEVTSVITAGSLRMVGLENPLLEPVAMSGDSVD